MNDPAQPSSPSPATAAARVGLLGPRGTFAEEALLTQPDLAGRDLVRYSTMADVLRATEAGEVEVGFVAIENSIEGTVNVTSDTAAVVHAAIVAALNQALEAAGDDADEALDCVVFGPQVWARLGEVSSGKTYMAMLMEHFAARGIPSTNWFVSNDLKNATASRNYMLVTRKAPSVNQPFFMVGESPTILTYPFGSASQTFYLNACAGFWAPFAWSMAVVQFAYAP